MVKNVFIQSFIIIKNISKVIVGCDQNYYNINTKQRVHYKYII